MDEAVEHLLSLKAAELLIAVVIFTFFVRRVIETEWPYLKKAASEMVAAKTYTSKMSSWWNQVILYAIPVVIGAALPLFVRELTPEGVTSTGSIILYGMKVGWFSSFGYKVLKQVVKKKTGLDLPGNTLPPPPDTTPSEAETESPTST